MVKNLFEPKSVALIGASRFKGKVGNAVARNLLNFKGKTFFVNPKAKKIFGRKCYASVLDIPGKLDLAVIAIKSEIVSAVLEECGKKKVKAAVVITAGFSEIGNMEAEQQLIETAKKHGIRLLGPNCLGTINPYIDLNTTFISIPVERGNIAFVSQSGALCSAALDIALQEQIGFSFFASVGNMVDIDFAELIEMLNKDEKTKAIILYIEALKPESGKKFIEVARSSSKPVIVIKAGISAAGAEAALTHTGSIATSYEVYKAAFRDAGIFEAKSLTNALDVAKFLTQNKKPSSIVVLSNAGGPAVLAADYCDQEKLKLAKLPQNVIDALNKALPATWSHHNPIDIVGDANAARYAAALNQLQGKWYDCLLCILTPQEMSQPLETAHVLVDFARKTKKTVIAAFLGGKRVSKASALLNQHNILCFPELKRVVDVLAVASQK